MDQAVSLGMYNLLLSMPFAKFHYHSHSITLQQDNKQNNYAAINLLLGAYFLFPTSMAVRPRNCIAATAIKEPLPKDQS
jgi:hypothetical protein